MERLFEVFETDDYGRAVNSLGTVYAESSIDAKQKVADYLNNDEIFTTGYYKAELARATIVLTTKNEYWKRKVREAEYVIRQSQKN